MIIKDKTVVWNLEREKKFIQLY